MSPLQLTKEEIKKLKDELKEDEHILFLDAVHPTHNTKAGFAWIQKGQEKFIETNSGRDRVNLNGVYNIHSGETGHKTH